MAGGLCELGEEAGNPHQNQVSVGCLAAGTRGFRVAAGARRVTSDWVVRKILRSRYRQIVSVHSASRSLMESHGPNFSAGNLIDHGCSTLCYVRLNNGPLSHPYPLNEEDRGSGASS